MRVEMSLERFEGFHGYLRVEKKNGKFSLDYRFIEVKYERKTLRMGYGFDLTKLKNLIEDMIEDFIDKVNEKLGKLHPKLVALRILELMLEGGSGDLEKVEKTTLETLKSFEERFDDLLDLLEEIERVVEKGFDTWRNGGVREFELYVETLRVEVGEVKLDLVA